MLLSHFTVSGLGIVVITIWTWFIQLRTKEAMSEGDGGEHRVEVTSDTSPQSGALSSQEGRHSRQRSSEHISEEGEEDELERERVIIQTDQESRGEDDDDSGIAELPCSYEEHLLKGQVLEVPGSRLKRERVCDILIQVFIPFMIAGFGMLAAGLLLDEVQVCTVVLTKYVSTLLVAKDMFTLPPADYDSEVSNVTCLFLMFVF